MHSTALRWAMAEKGGQTKNLRDTCAKEMCSACLSVDLNSREHVG
jgi:hypothetical protein